MNQPVLVTGASSGIGRGVVQRLTEEGYVVHAVARRADFLTQLHEETGCETHALDVTDADAVDALVKAIQPGVVVANAGRGGGFEGIAATSTEDIRATIGLNVTATLELLRLAVPGMVERRQGHVILLGSVAALYPSPSALYGGSKAAIRLIAQNLRLELQGTGVRVTDIRPGRVSSEFYDVAIADPVRAAAAKSTGVRELDPRDIGDAVLFALRAPPHVNVSAIEVQPLEQTYGGTSFDPV